MIKIVKVVLNKIVTICTGKQNPSGVSSNVNSVNDPLSSLESTNSYSHIISEEETEALFSILGIEDFMDSIPPELHSNYQAIVNLNNALIKINPDNISLTLEIGKENYEQKRNLLNKFNSPSSQVLNELIARRSLINEAIFCSLSKSIDLRAFQTYFNQCINQKSSKEVSLVNNFLSSNIKFEDLNTQLYELDITRRVGNLKKDLRYFANEKAKFEGLKKEILESLQSFEDRNKTLLMMGNISNDYNEAKLNLIVACKEDFLKLEPNFYEQVCQNFAIICKTDFILNQENLKTLVRTLENNEKH